MASRKKSALATYERISPNKNIPRNGKIRRITPHCVAGNCTIEVVLGLSKFVNYSPTSGASASYAVGTDGRIGLGVEETNRPWTSSSPTNDHEAITFEIANNGGAPDWRMSDAAINSWLNLAVDIAKFYGFKKVNYQPKPANITIAQTEVWIKTWAKADEMIVTLHNWFSATVCPGPYFTRQVPWLVREMNKRLQDPKWIPEPFVGEGSSPVVTQSTTSTTTTKLPAATTVSEKGIWDFLKGKKLNDFAIAGIMGNLFAESGLKFNILEKKYATSLKMTDASYTKAVDDGSYNNFVKDSAGYGLAQWTYYTRKQALLDFAKKQKVSISDANMQLEFLWNEMSNSYKTMMAALGKVTSVRAASDLVLTDFERPADQSEAVKKKRADYGQGYYDKYAIKVTTQTTPSTPASSTFKEYPITITVAALNVRKGPGVNNPVVTTLLNDKNTYTIVDEAIASDGGKWGKLKSGIGWIGLAYTKKK